MTIEARQTLPAGWYTDPASADRKRWWDGSQWTEHVRSEPRPAPAAAAKTIPNPYGLQGVVSAPRAPLSDEELAAPPARDEVKPNNNISWIALLFGLLAVGFTVLPSLPLSQLVWVVGGATVAVACGLFALAQRRSGRTSNAWAPVIGVLLAVAAASVTISGVNVASLVSSIAPGPTPVNSQPAIATVPTTSSVPFVFSSNAQLTADETAAQSVATAINRSFADGAATLTTGEAWPTSIHMSGSVVVASNGDQLATLPSGLSASLQLSDDQKSYRIAVTGTNKAELATYSSAQNAFSWSCLADNKTCVPAN